MPSIIVFFFLFGLVGAVFIAPAIMSFGLVKISDGYITMNERILSYIPVYNLFYGWYKYTGNIFSPAGMGSLLFILASLVRVANMYLFYFNTASHNVTIIFFIVSTVAMYLGNVVQVFIILRDSKAYTFNEQLLLSLTVIFGQISIGKYLQKKVAYYEKKNGNLL